MHVTDMIMVITNDKGTEKGSLMIYPDYLEKVIFDRADDYEDVAKLVEDIVTTRGTDGDWAECYSLGNKSIYCQFMRRPAKNRAVCKTENRRLGLSWK